MTIIQGVLIIILLVLSWGFIVFGMVSVFKLKNLYTRILSAATIDSMASLTILIALLVAGITEYEFVIRLLLLIGFLLITNPISSHVNIRSAYITGYDVQSLQKHGDNITVGDVDGF
ncbi:cation:proton antiporter [Candidatus Xianfuyuplasma coldseepsis]|uniref:Cation:proton antiporter n=1 Tax=Candidatus Xianfuyuplasma coldseepsis TaxID=2782163 RepID=A0A7L7KPF3_9MOLU|nr:monovalent cation/H(+) antiporter subunit G [Xianfuyuplasma coldseepsis]QMS84661.1 cation:proton antiporter [Xianfuyuplasma coldseepsis]